MTDSVAPDRLHPVTLVLGHLREHSEAFRLTPAAWLLAVVLAHYSRRLVNGSYVCWRGRKLLSTMTGLTMRTVTAARGQLDAAGIIAFRFSKAAEPVTGADGQTYYLKKGVLVATLISNPAAYREAREAAWTKAPATRRDESTRKRIDKKRKSQAKVRRLDEERQINNSIHALRVELGNRVLRGEISDADYRARIDAAKADARTAIAQGKSLHPNTEAVGQ